MENNAIDPLREQLAIMRNSLFDEKMLDVHYRLVEELADSKQPNFAEDIMNVFFQTSAEKIAIFEKALENPPSDFSEVKIDIFQLKGSSSSVGACKVRVETDKLMDCINNGDMEMAKIALEHVKKERDTLEGRMEPYFQLLRQVEPSRKSQGPKSSIDLNK